jgi:DNA adenine methylase
MRAVLKWAGGKSEIADQIFSKFPKQFNTYWEPFAGGCSVASFVFENTQAKIKLSDVNADLISFYRNLKHQLECKIIINELLKIKKQFNSSLDQLSIYQDLREEFNTTARVGIRRSVLFFFLNKTSFNGLTRYNNRGEYNVPFGKRNFSFDPQILKQFSQFLRSKRVDIFEADFSDIRPKANDVVYLDPPYHPLTTTAKFNTYHASGWTETKEIKLHDCFNQWKDVGAYPLMSNHDVLFIRELFNGCQFYELKARRSIGTKLSTRKKITEVLVTP